MKYPQVNFTVQSVFCELYQSGIDFEVICINNWCEEAARQNRVEDQGWAYLKKMESGEHVVDLELIGQGRIRRLFKTREQRFLRSFHKETVAKGIEL